MLQKRVANFELIRIISMALIVVHHSIIHGVFFNNDHFTFELFRSDFLNFTLGNIFISGGKVGVILFIFISGYFSNVNNFKLKKIMNLGFQTLFYSLCGLIIAIILHKAISIEDIIKSIFPIIYGKYWFVTTYVILYIFSPIILMGFDSLSRKYQRYTFVSLFLIVVIIPTFLPKSLDTIQSELLQFVLFFLIGHQFHNYNLNDRLWKKFGKISFLSSTILYVLSVLFIELISIITQTTVFKQGYYFSSSKSILTLFCSVGVFILIKNIKIGSTLSKYINKASNYVFGIYLIHDNSFLRPIIWQDIFNMNNAIMLSPILFILKVVISSLIVFILCLIIEMIRKFIFGNIEKKVSLKISLVIHKNWEYILNKIHEGIKSVI